ncbi:AKAP7-like phosphoesterase domain-containing protein [Clostridium sp. DL1XJH146]
MQYYLVGIIDKLSYDKIQELQVNLSKMYNLYDDLPKLHITLEIIKEPSLNELEIDLDFLLKDIKKIPLTIEKGICFNPPFKSVNLKVEKTDEIVRFINMTNSKLKELGYNVRENIENWDLHISIANTNFSNHEWSTGEFNEACNIILNNKYSIHPLIEQIQLWKPINDKDNMVKYNVNLK